MFTHSTELTFPKMTQRNLPMGRIYVVEEGPDAGQYFPSITRVLAAQPKPALDAWKVRVGAAEASIQSARATIRGVSLHTLMECYVANDVLPKYSPVVGEFG